MTEPLTRRFAFTELERELVHNIAMILCNAGDLTDYLGTMTQDQADALHCITNKTLDPIPEVALWRTLPDHVQDAIIEEYMDCESISKDYAQTDLDEITQFGELAMMFADIDLLAALYREECCVDDFRNTPLDRSDPEWHHWNAFILMQAAGMFNENEKVTDLGKEAYKWDRDEDLE